MPWLPTSNDGRLEAAEIDTTYTLGHDIISEQDANGLFYLLYDGRHGSTRALLDTAGAIIAGQRFAYDAYGNMLTGAGLATANTAFTRFLYSGEQTDATGLQYLRARYYNAASGRFNRLDPFAGNISDPQSLHKYLYGHGDPVGNIDPTGELSVLSVQISITIGSGLIGTVTGAVLGGTRGALIGAGLGLATGASIAFFWGVPLQRALVIYWADLSVLLGTATVTGDRIIKSRFGQVAVQRLNQLRDTGARTVELFTRIGSSPDTGRSLHTATTRALADGGNRATKVANELYRLRIPDRVLQELRSIGAVEKQRVVEQADDVAGEAWVFLSESIPYIMQFLEKIE